MACCSPFGIPPSQDMPHQSDIDRVAAEIATVEEDIKKVERQLEEAGKRDLTNLSEEEKKEARDEKKYLQEKEKQLRKKEEQLRKKEEQLREEKILLLKQPSGETVFLSLCHSLLHSLSFF